MVSDARVLFSWGSIPTTTNDNVLAAQTCLRTQGLKTEFLPHGCWRSGAKVGGDAGEALAQFLYSSCPLPPNPLP
jgi:hypothetical protein